MKRKVYIPVITNGDDAMFDVTKSDKTYDGFTKRDLTLTDEKVAAGMKIKTAAVTVMAQGDGVVYVDYSLPRGGITVKDHFYSGSSHLVYDEAEKTWEVMGKPYFTRDDHKDVTQTVAYVLHQFLFQTVKEFAKMFPDDMTNATRQRIRNDIDRLSKKREALRQEIGDVDAEIEKLNARL